MYELCRQTFRLLAVVLVGISTPVWAALVIPGADGSDGVFAPVGNVEIDLSLAPTASWDTPGSGDGVYDPDKWAVVFKFSAVDIPAGVTVTFRNHDSRAPVVWLVDGDVNIAGTLNLDGQQWIPVPYSAEPGPGGFAGGKGYQTDFLPSGGGFGIGGGLNSNYGGSHATAGYVNPSPTYGNPRALPLVGGSGGGGDPNSGTGGAGGGGALLLAVAGALTVDGSIQALGGTGLAYVNEASGSGAGGSIRLVAETVGGSGTIWAVGGPTFFGGDGRVRIEALNAISAWDVQPPTTVVAPDDPVLLWLPMGAPTVEVVSIANAGVPADPHARLDPGREDIFIEILGGDADILVETTNVDTVDAAVQVRITPEYGAPFFVDAVFDSGTLEQATWRATTALPVGYFTVQAHAVNPSL